MYLEEDIGYGREQFTSKGLAPKEATSEELSLNNRSRICKKLSMFWK